MKKNGRSSILVLSFFLVPTAAFAHAGHSTDNVLGFAYLIGVVLFLAVWAAQSRGQSLWCLVWSFMSSMARSVGGTVTLKRSAKKTSVRDSSDL